MNPDDLLFLHSMLAATIKTQQAIIDRLTAEVAGLSTPTEEPSCPTPSAT